MKPVVECACKVAFDLKVRSEWNSYNSMTKRIKKILGEIPEKEQERSNESKEFDKEVK